MDFDVLKRVLAALEARGVHYAIFGAVALNLHGLARSTEDLDLFIEPESGNIERLRQALRDAIDDPDIDGITAADLLGNYPAVQYFPPGGAFHIDILTRLGDAFQFSDLETERVAYEDITVTAVTPRMLYRMKRDTVRPKDRADAAAIRQRFDLRRVSAMPVYKYRSIEEMDAHTWRTPGDPTLYRAIAFTWELARRTNPRRFTPGLYKYRNIDEMNRADDQRLREHLEARRDVRG